MIKGICLEGGGAAGIAHIGALRNLDLTQTTHFVGSSAGGILAAALACGATLDYLQHVMWNTDFTKFFDDSWGFVRDVERLINRFGWYKGEELRAWIEGVVLELTGDADITFEQAHKKYGTFLELTVTDINVRESGTVYISHETDPHMMLRTAIHRTALIPVFYKADNVYDENECLYHYYVDGGIMDNYPLWRLYRHLDPSECIGLKLMTSKDLNEIDHKTCRDDEECSSDTIHLNLIQYLKLIVTMLRAQAMKSHVKDEDWARTVAIDVGHVSATDFNLSDETKQFLLDQGHAAAHKFKAKKQTQEE